MYFFALVFLLKMEVLRFRNVADISPSGLTSGNGMHNYIAQNNGYQIPNDTKTLGSAYDHYFQSAGPGVIS
jgi:hypothetical protein